MTHIEKWFPSTWCDFYLSTCSCFPSLLCFPFPLQNWATVCDRKRCVEEDCFAICWITSFLFLASRSRSSHSVRRVRERDRQWLLLLFAIVVFVVVVVCWGWCKRYLLLHTVTLFFACSLFYSLELSSLRSLRWSDVSFSGLTMLLLLLLPAGSSPLLTYTHFTTQHNDDYDWWCSWLSSSLRILIFFLSFLSLLLLLLHKLYNRYPEKERIGNLFSKMAACSVFTNERREREERDDREWEINELTCNNTKW